MMFKTDITPETKFYCESCDKPLPLKVLEVDQPKIQLVETVKEKIIAISGPMETLGFMCYPCWLKS